MALFHLIIACILFNSSADDSISSADDTILRSPLDSNNINDEICISCEIEKVVNSYSLWSCFWILWIAGMILILIDIFIILRDCIVTFYITHYEEINGDISNWRYLEHNAYRLQSEYNQDKCSLCCATFTQYIPQSLLFCGDRFCRDCINTNEHNRWTTYRDGILAYEWSECPTCDVQYNIMRMKYEYNYNPYLGFWSFYSNTFKKSLIERIFMFITSVILYKFIFCYGGF
eukprot:274239_1